MCGIIVSIVFNGQRRTTVDHEEFIPWIATRGPDSLKTHTVQFSTPDTQNTLTLTFTSSVLHLRGKEVTVQPLISSAGDILCWNGEIWKGLEIKDDENDGAKLLEALSSTNKVWEVMERIEGPWAMVYYSARDGKVYYGRDCLGRRSLLRGQTEDGSVCLLSSIAVGSYSWGDDKVDGLWCIDLNEWIQEGQQVSAVSVISNNDQCPAKLYPWVSESSEANDAEGYLLRPYPSMNRELPTGDVEDPDLPREFLQVLTDALSIRTRTIPETHIHRHHAQGEDIPRIAVLFSGGLDCSVLAWIIHTLLSSSESIDLINVAFENPRTIALQKIHPKEVYAVCPDRITGRAGWEELWRLSHDTSRKWRFVEVQRIHTYLRVRLILRTRRHSVEEMRSCN